MFELLHQHPKSAWPTSCAGSPPTVHHFARVGRPPDAGCGLCDLCTVVMLVNTTPQPILQLHDIVCGRMGLCGCRPSDSSLRNPKFPDAARDTVAGYCVAEAQATLRSKLCAICRVSACGASGPARSFIWVHAWCKRRSPGFIAQFGMLRFVVESWRYVSVLVDGRLMEGRGQLLHTCLVKWCEFLQIGCGVAGSTSAPGYTDMNAGDVAHRKTHQWKWCCLQTTIRAPSTTATRD